MKPYILAFVLSLVSIRAAEYSYPVTEQKLWDLTGEYHAGDESVDQEITLIHNANGDLTGEYREDYHGTGGDLTGSGSLVGKVSRTASGLRAKTRLDFAGSGTFAEGGQGDVTVRGPGLLVVEGNSLQAVFAARMCVDNGSGSDCVKRVVGMEGFTLPESMTGDWTLTLNVEPNASRIAGTAVVQLSNGRELPFTVAGRQAKSGTVAMTLTGTGDAAGTKLQLSTDGEFQLTKLTGRLLGQALAIRR